MWLDEPGLPSCHVEVMMKDACMEHTRLATSNIRDEWDGGSSCRLVAVASRVVAVASRLMVPLPCVTWPALACHVLCGLPCPAVCYMACSVLPCVAWPALACRVLHGRSVTPCCPPPPCRSMQVVRAGRSVTPCCPPPGVS